MRVCDFSFSIIRNSYKESGNIYTIFTERVATFVI